MTLARGQILSQRLNHTVVTHFAELRFVLKMIQITY